MNKCLGKLGVRVAKTSKVLMVVLVLMTIALTLPTMSVAKLSDGSDEGNFFTNLFSSKQSVWGDTLVQPGESKIYQAQMTSGHACGNIKDTPIKWFVSGVDATSAIDFISHDSTTSKLVVGAYSGYANIRFKRAGDYTVKVVYNCLNGQVVTETLPVKVASTCTNQCSSVGQRQCTTNNGFRECINTNGCLVWGSAWVCGDNQECAKSSYSGVLSCQPKNQCSANTAKCVGETQFDSCEYDKGALTWIRKSVPDGYLCQARSDGTANLVRKPEVITDPCKTLNCNDNNPNTDDRCVAGQCINTPNCAKDEVFFNGECELIQDTCEVTGEGGCLASIWIDYPECRWDDAQCETTCDKTCLVGEELNVNDCVCEPINKCDYEFATFCNSQGKDCKEGLCVDFPQKKSFSLSDEAQRKILLGVFALFFIAVLTPAAYYKLRKKK